MKLLNPCKYYECCDFVNMADTNKIRNDLNLLKGFAILAVVLYHMGISKSGYLGVDVFFVISGFLITPKIVELINIGNFKYFSFLEQRIIRLFPLLLFVSIFSLIIGYIGMLPDDYENLSQSVIASICFSNNILSAITTWDYWEITNEFKPLMHTWYIGILFEYYLIFPLVVILLKRLSNKYKIDFIRFVLISIFTISIISFLLYISPIISEVNKFYLFPSRFFEIAFGGLAGILIRNKRQNKLYKGGAFSCIFLVILLFVIYFSLDLFDREIVGYNIVSGEVLTKDNYLLKSILLIITVLFTLFYVVFENTKNKYINILVDVKWICLLGVMSYSIYIWHQPIIAFYRYFIDYNISTLLLCILGIIILFISYLSYRLIEQKIKISRFARYMSLFLFLLVSSIAFINYMNAGVVRDIPEYEVKKGEAYRNMFSKYNDRLYEYDVEFPNNDKKNILIIGNSFARDFGNILLESNINERINISYIYNIEDIDINRVKNSDFIFIFGWKTQVPSIVWDNLKEESEVWGIGTKNYGYSNGQIYKNRYNADYFKQPILINPNFFIINKQLKSDWNNKYIDFIEISSCKNGEIKVFTDNNKFISQDTRHLTKSGAEYYSRKIDLKKLLKL